MRKVRISKNEYYHVFNRGNNKQEIFFDQKDYTRFLFLLLYFQSPIVFRNIDRQINYFRKKSTFNIPKDELLKIIKEKYVELVNFTLMPNHFHLTIFELKEGGISQYMQRVLNSYTKYINKKYGKSGHLFQGPFHAVHIEDNEQLLYLSAYIHMNQRGIKNWKDKEAAYTWSSFKDYLEKNRWGKLLSNNIIIDQFEDAQEYKIFVEKSNAKKSLEEKLLIDLT